MTTALTSRCHWVLIKRHTCSWLMRGSVRIADCTDERRIHVFVNKSVIGSSFARMMCRSACIIIFNLNDYLQLNCVIS